MAGSAETSQAGREPGAFTTPRAGFLRRLGSTYRSEVALAVAILLIAGVVSLWSPQVFSNGNIANVAQAAAPLVIMSLGVLLVIITSGIDLSVGSTFSLSGMVAGLAMLAGASWPIACLAGLSVGLAIGADQWRSGDVRRPRAIRRHADNLRGRRESGLRHHRWPLHRTARSDLLSAQQRPPDRRA